MQDEVIPAEPKLAQALDLRGLERLRALAVFVFCCLSNGSTLELSLLALLPDS